MRWLSVLFVLLFILPARGQADDTIDKIPVPEAEISIPDDADKTKFDLYLADKLRGAILARYTDDSFQIVHPEDLLDQLPPIKDRVPVLALCSGPIHGSREVAGVGSISFDLTSFKITVRLEPALLFSESLSLKNRLPAPEKNFSLQQSVRLSAVGGGTGGIMSSLNHRSLASRGMSWLNLDGTFLREESQRYELTEVSANTIVDDLTLNAGFLQTEGQFFRSTLNIAGAGLRSSEDIYLDQDSLRGSKLEIFVPSRSRVEFFRGSRLLSVQTLEYGLQEVDTSSFPQGSYEVKIDIVEDDGTVTTEKRFFVKSGLLAVRARPVYSIQAGVLRRDAEVFDTPVVQAGIVSRVADALQVSSSIYATSELQTLSLNSLGIYRDLVVGGGILSSAENDMAYTASALADFEPLSIDFSTTQAIRGFEDRLLERDRIQKEQALLHITSSNDDELVSETLSSTTGNATLLLGSVTLRYSLSEAETLADGKLETRTVYGPRITWDIVRDAQRTVRCGLSRLDTSEGVELNAQLSFGYRWGVWLSEADLVERSVDNRQETFVLFRLVYDGKAPSQKGLRVKTASEMSHRRFDATDEGAAANSLVATNAIEADGRSDFIAASGFVRDSRSDNSGSTGGGINLESGFVVADGGGTSAINPSTSEAVLIAEIKSNLSDSKLDVVVDDQVKETVRGNGKVVIPVTPYKVVKVGIRPTEDASLMSYDTTEYSLVAFPGNILHRVWNVEQVFIGLGRILDEKGEPIPLERIKGVKEYALTEEDGTFQAELSGTEPLFIESDKYHCKITLPPITRKKEVVNFGDLVCKSVAKYTPSD